MKKLLLPILAVLFGSYLSTFQAQVSIQPEPDNPDMVKVYVKHDPSTYQKPVPQSSQVDFAVQVTASSKPILESVAKKEWNELGHVYVQQENGLYKIRIGPYETQLEAKETLLKAKSKGRTDAFIVVLQGTANDKPLYQSGMETKTLAQPKSEKSVVAENAIPKAVPVSSDIPGAEYKVQVASYSKPGAFNPNGIEQLGKLESYRKGDMTLMMIGGFKNLPDARKARDKAVSKGFKDASIVVDNNGILEKVTE